MLRSSALTTVVAVVAMLATGMASAAAQEGTPSPATFADAMGLPELRVRVTDTAYEGLPAETPAGRYLVTLEIEAAEGGALSFMQLPEGMSVDDFMALLAGPTAASPEPPLGTPVAEVGPPAEGEGPEGPPEWYYQTKMAGGTGGFPRGQTLQVIVELTPGEWIAWADDPESPQAPVGLTVTGEAGATPAAGAEPAADVTATMFEYDFRLEGALGTGPQVIKVANVGAQPHHMFMVRTPGPITEEQIAQILELEAQGATPAPEAGLPDPDTFVPVAYMSTLSTEATAWLPVDLEPGHYVMVCFVPDVASGMPHAFEGMYEVITVGADEGTPTG